MKLRVKITNDVIDFTDEALALALLATGYYEEIKEPEPPRRGQRKR